MGNLIALSFEAECLAKSRIGESRHERHVHEELDPDLRFAGRLDEDLPAIIVPKTPAERSQAYATKSAGLPDVCGGSLALLDNQPQ